MRPEDVPLTLRHGIWKRWHPDAKYLYSAMSGDVWAWHTCYRTSYQVTLELPESDDPSQTQTHLSI